MKKTVLLAAVTIMTFLASAETTPFKFSVFSPAELPPTQNEIVGFRLNLIYGRASGMTGLDLGLSQHVRGDACGAQIGACNFVTGIFDGAQFAYGSNFALTEMNGLQVGWYNCCRGKVTGVQIGAVNWTYDMEGVQIGVINFIWHSSLVAFPIVNMLF